MTIRIFIADDHGVLRGGLRALVESQPDMKVVGEAADGLDAEAGILETNPDVAVLDISMPLRGGIETIASVIQKRPETRILVLTVHEEPSFVRAAIAAGAVGYVVKSVVDTEFIAAVRLAANRGNDPDTISSHLARHGRPLATNASGVLLSDREREVLGLIAQGHTNREVASQLRLSIKSVETYRARSMEKLGLRSRAELVRYALDTGLLQVRAR
jgi:DNA-binding NarL/FixJ family response regulator